MQHFNLPIPALTLFLFISALSISGCSPSPGPSSKVILIALENFGAEDFSCHKEGAPSSLSSLCDESVRFNHAWTTSTSSSVALGSLLTAQYPGVLGYQNPDTEYLPPNSQTITKKIPKSKTASALFSSGFPVTSRTGLGIGFDLFDDSGDPASLFRPIRKNIELFKTWYLETAKDSFFAVFYANDLRALNRATRTMAKDLRPRSYESQLEELDDAIGELITFLKQQKKWNDTWVIVSGLNGRPNRDHFGTTREPLPQSYLHSDRTQVSLLIKPPTKPRDGGLDWDIDENVSLIDVGHLIQKIFDLNFVCSDCVDLFKAIQSVAIEHKWRGIPIQSPIVYKDKTLVAHAFRVDNWLGIIGSQHTFYNSLTDRLENNKIVDTKQLPPDVRNYYFDLLKKQVAFDPSYKKDNTLTVIGDIKQDLESNFLGFPNRLSSKNSEFICSEISLDIKSKDLKATKCNNSLYMKFADFAASGYSDQNAKKVFLREYIAFEKSRQVALWAYNSFGSQFVYLKPTEVLHFVDFYLGNDELKTVKKEIRQIASYELLQVDEVVK